MLTWNNSPAGPQTVAAKHDLRSALLAGPSLGRAPLCTVLFLLGEKIITFHFKKTSGKQTSEKHVGKMRFLAVRETVSFCILMGKKMTVEAQNLSLYRFEKTKPTQLHLPLKSLDDQSEH